MPTPTYRPLANITLGSAVSSVSFSAIPASYRDLIIVMTAKSTRTAGDQDGCFLRLNNDASNNTRVTMLGSGAGVSSNIESNLGMPLGGNAAALMVNIIQVMDYSATDKHKTVLVRANTNAPSVSGVVYASAGRWASTSAVTSLVLLPEIGPNFAVDSTFNLYGVIA